LQLTVTALRWHGLELRLTEYKLIVVQKLIVTTSASIEANRMLCVRSYI